MAEGARFELADPLRGLRFSRPARSAAPSPLHQICCRYVEVRIFTARLGLRLFVLLAPGFIVNNERDVSISRV